MKHVGAVQLFGTLENVDGSEVAALPLEVRGTLRSEGGESAGYEVAVEKQLRAHMAESKRSATRVQQVVRLETSEARTLSAQHAAP